MASLCFGNRHPSTTITGARRPGQTHSLAPTGWLIADPACRPVFIFGTGVRSGALHGACDRFTFPSECRIASIGHARKLDQDLFLVFGFGLADPTLRFLGILPELISL
jgi:hypothetical protein